MFSKKYLSIRLVTVAVVVLIAIWLLQAAFFYYSFKQAEKVFGERTEKLSLAARLIELTSRQNLIREDEEEMRSCAYLLAETSRTPRGQELSQDLVEAVEHFLSLPPQERENSTAQQELARQNDIFQRQRLKEEVFNIRMDLRRLFTILAASSGGAFLLSGFLMYFLLIGFLRQMGTTEMVIKNTRNAILVGDQRGRITMVNPVFTRMTGKSPQELIGLPFEAAGPTGTLLAGHLKKGEEVIDREVLWQTPDGSRKCFTVDVVYLKDKRNRVQGSTAILRDITAQWKKRKKDEEEKAALTEMAQRDGLTGLLNHRALMEELESMVKRTLNEGQPLALLLLDMDYFKICNDILGHSAGDRILVEFAKLLEKSVREHDLAARYGGDEFVVVLPDTDGVSAYQIAERLCRRIADHPFPGREVLPGGRLTASIGVAVTTCAGIDSAGSLVRAADEALYTAKLGSRNRTELYHSALSELKEAVHKDQ